MEHDENAEADKEELERDPYADRKSVAYWKRFIKAGKAAAKRNHWPSAKAAWKEYECAERDRSTSGTTEEDEYAGSSTIYWEACEYLKPAYYSRPPKITTKRQVEIDDTMANLMCKITVRLGEYLKCESDYDATMQASVDDFIHAGKAAPQVKYSFDIEERPARVPLMPTQEQVVDPDGVAYPSFATEQGEEWLEQVEQDEGGYFGMMTEQVEVNKKIEILPLPFDDVIHTPTARHWGEVKELAYYFCLSRAEAEAVFAPEVIKNIKWIERKVEGSKEDRDSEDDQYSEEKDLLGDYVEGYECYCKHTGNVYWFSEQYTDGFLHKEEDTNKLKNFFPQTKFIISSKPRKSLYPTPRHKRLKAISDQLAELEEKERELISSIERRAIVAGNDDLIAALNSSRDTYVIAENISALLEKGGLDGLVLWIPLGELVESLKETIELKQQKVTEYFTKFGIPDLLRGASDPRETLGAQMLKATAVNDRFKLEKRMVYEMCRESLELMVDLALEKFSDEEIGAIVGAQFFDKGEKAIFPQALMRLRNDESRAIAINIDIDSLSFVDEQIRANETAAVSQTVMQGFQNIAQTMQINPQAGAVLLRVMLHLLEITPTGRDIQEETKNVVDSMIEQAMQPPPQQPPPPDYEMMKIQLQSQKQQVDAALKSRDIEVKQLKAMLENQKDQADFSLNKQMQDFLMQIEAIRIQIDQFKAQAAVAESAQEERRLAEQVGNERFVAMLEAQTKRLLGPDGEGKGPPIVVNNVMSPKPMAKKTVRIEEDTSGNMRLIEETTHEQSMPITVDENGNATLAEDI